MNCEIVKSVALLILYSVLIHSCVLKQTFCLARSIGLPSKRASVKWDPQSREIENISQEYSRIKKTTSMKIRPRYCEKFTP